MPTAYVATVFLWFGRFMALRVYTFTHIFLSMPIKQGKRNIVNYDTVSVQIGFLRVGIHHR